MQSAQLPFSGYPVFQGHVRQMFLLPLLQGTDVDELGLGHTRVHADVQGRPQSS